MNNLLLIAILVISTITMISSLFIAIVVAKKSDKDVIKNAGKIVGIVFVCLLVLFLTIGVSKIDKKSSSSDNKKTEDTESSDDELSAAGFNKVSLDEYLSLIKKDEKSIVLIARPTCAYCQKFTPILKQAMEDMKLTINYIDTDTLSEDDWSKFTDSLDYLKNNEWGTPTVLIVQNGKSVAENSGYVELETIKKFFTDNGFGE